MNDGFAKYFSVDDAARILGVDRARIYDWKRQGIVKPVLTKGQMAFDRAALARMAVLVALQSLLGMKSEKPAAVLREKGPEIDRWLDDLDDDQPAQIELRCGRAVATVWVPLIEWLRPTITSVPV